MDKSTHGSEPIRNEKTGMKRTPEFILQPCEVCFQMTNHIDGDCQKCAEKLRREAMSPDDELIEYLRSDEHRTAIAIEVLREKIEELEVAYIGEYESITGRRLDITYLRKSIELLTKK